MLVEAQWWDSSGGCRTIALFPPKIYFILDILCSQMLISFAYRTLNSQICCENNVSQCGCKADVS